MNWAFPARKARALTGTQGLFETTVHNRLLANPANSFSFFDGCPEDDLLEVHLHAEVLADPSSCVW